MKKILFSDRFGLTQAVLDGRKTMTRRIVPDGVPLGNWSETLKKSRYQPGEVVAVAQNLRDMGYNPRDTRHRIGEIWGLDHCTAWTNKMFVCASECKHHIRITNVRMEKLQDISEEDCFKEGIYWDYDDYPYMVTKRFKYDEKDEFIRPIAAFAALIDKVSSKGTWDSNPWVFVYEFELVTCKVMNDNKLTAKDLMIGDWVYNTYHKKNIRITPYDFFVHGHDKNGRQYVIGNMLSLGRDLEPIPLTPEILERNGWKFCENMSDSLARTFVDKNSEITFYPNAIDGCECLVRIEAKPKTCGGVNRVHHCEIRHVHQIQHALKLCGIEKQITI